MWNPALAKGKGTTIQDGVLAYQPGHYLASPWETNHVTYTEDGQQYVYFCKIVAAPQDAVKYRRQPYPATPTCGALLKARKSGLTYGAGSPSSSRPRAAAASSTEAQPGRASGSGELGSSGSRPVLRAQGSLGRMCGLSAA